MKHKEQLLTLIIEDAIKKGAPIIGWEYSVNGRVIILRHNRIPQYCINLFQAADMLIHQYNLTKEYGFIYAKKGMNAPLKSQTTPQISNSGDMDYESRCIEMCNDLLFSSSQQFNVDTQNKIYSIIHRAYDGNEISKDGFLRLRSKLSAFYRDKNSYAQTAEEKNKLRPIIRFFENMRYEDFLELF